MGTIHVKDLSKAYRQYPSRWAKFLDWVLPTARSRHTDKFVLQDISFDVAQGEAIGIIGINGAGKSTLLKIITGTTRPTKGSVTVIGRVAALLELGIGFHPDFSGRQNAYMAGQLLGYSVKDIDRLMPEIEAFAEIGDYIDQPVRVYSSGMQMRLAFSVATAVRPDILIVDEALSVGDAYFQHKSFDRIRAFRELGTTLLIVSHDKAAIQAVCDRALLLNHGRIAFEGAPEAVMDYYNALLADQGNSHVQQRQAPGGSIQTQSGSGEVLIESAGLFDESGQPLAVVEVSQTVRLSVRVKTMRPTAKLTMGFMIKDRLGQVIYGTNTFHLNQELSNLVPDEIITFNVDFIANLGEGSYSISTSLHAGATHIDGNYDWRDRAIIFQVINVRKEHFVGSSWIPQKIEIIR